MSFFSRFPDVGSGQRPGKPKIQTLVAANVWKMLETKHWPQPMSRNSQNPDVGRDQRLENRKKKTLDGSNV
jgi:hypothetical protein